MDRQALKPSVSRTLPRPHPLHRPGKAATTPTGLGRPAVGNVRGDLVKLAQQRVESNYYERDEVVEHTVDRIIGGLSYELAIANASPGPGIAWQPGEQGRLEDAGGTYRVEVLSIDDVAGTAAAFVRVVEVYHRDPVMGLHRGDDGTWPAVMLQRLELTGA